MLAIRVMPLADALAIVFVAPFIVLPVGKFYLGEDVGPRRVGAAIVGFVGVLVCNAAQFSQPSARWPCSRWERRWASPSYILVTRGLSPARGVHPCDLAVSIQAL